VRSKRTTGTRTLLVLLAAAALGVVAAWLAGTAGASLARVRAPGPAALDDAVLAGAACVGALVALWLCVGTAVSVVGLLRARPTRSRILPASLHQLVGVGLGVALLGVTLPVATSATGPATSGSAPTESSPAVVGSVDPGWAPAVPPPPVRTAAPADPLVVAAPRAGTAVEETVVVRRGDTLWDIAARHLPADADDADIAAAWPRWYAANASVIGSDPDLLLPGQLLVPPDAR